MKVKRMIRLSRVLLLLLMAGMPKVTAAQEQPEPIALIRAAVEREKVNDKKAREYMYVEREVNRKKRGDGFKTEIETSEVFYLYGDRIKRRIAKDDKPLSESEAKKEEERIAKLVEKHKNASESDRKKKEEQAHKEEEDDQKVFDEVAHAFDFKMEGVDSLGGRDAWVIQCEPRKDYRPKTKEAKILQKVRFKVWIDKEETQWAKVEADVIDGIGFGLFLAKLERGAHFQIQAMRVNEEVWLPTHVALTADARVLF